MSIRAPKTLLTCLLSYLLAQPAVLLATDTPSINLFTFYADRSTSQSMSDPLLLYVIIDNSAASGVKRNNQRNQQIVEQYEQTEDFQSLSKIEKMEFYAQYPLRDVPEFKLGSGQTSVASLVNFLVRDGQGNNIDIAIRPLQANDHQPKTITLQGERSLSYQFVVESDQLRQLSPATYHFVASLDTTRQADMWNGWIYSNNVDIALSETHPQPGWDTSNLRMLLHSTFLVDDHQYKKAEDHARLWIEQHPDSINAWSQLGEALHGLGQKNAALEAYNTALIRFRSKHGDNPAELPQELLDKITAIEES